ncbi:MAG: HAD hydrolase family protein [Ruthenibacterium sp.]
MATLYITDLDGTLLNAEGALPQSTVDILRPLLAQGLLLTVATARSPATAVELLRPLCLKQPAVLMAGTMLYDLQAAKTLSTTRLTRAAVTAVCDMLETTGREAMAYCVRDGALFVYYKYFTCELEREFSESRLHSPYKTFVRVKHYPAALKGSDPLMFLFCLPDLRTAHTYYTLLSAVPDVTCYFYAYEYSNNGYVLEVYPAGCDKGSALAQLRACTGADQIIAFGDNNNDVPLFHAADESCAVQNAVSEAKAAATRVIGANTQDGVAKWIAAHWRAENAACQPLI